MMNFSTYRIAAVMLTASAILPVAAESVSKASAGINVINDDDATLTSIVARYNYGLNRGYLRYVGIEGEISYGVLDDEVTFGTSSVDLEAKFGYGVYATGRYPLGTKGSDVFLRLGYASQDFEANLSNVSAADEVNGFAYGIGANVMITESHGARLDYLRIEGEDDASVDNYSVSYVYQY